VTRELRLALLTLAAFLGLTLVAVGPSDTVLVAGQVPVVALYAAVAAYGIGPVSRAVYPALEIRFGSAVAAVGTGVATVVLALSGAWLLLALVRASGVLRRRARSA
jgi:hypothetical protein